MCDVKNKSSECFNCGESSHRGNSCPLIYGTSVRSLGNYSAKVGEGNSVARPAPSSNSASSSSSSASSSPPRPSPVCYAWSSYGECGRDRCSYPHPPNRRAELGVCFNFRDRGVCHFGDRCKYKHSGPPMASAAPASSASPAPASAPASSPIAVSSSSTAIRVELDGFQIMSHKKKRRVEEEKKELEQKSQDDQ
jgi:hypothetical protein